MESPAIVTYESFLGNSSVKEFWKSVDICRSYDQKSSVLFFETYCTLQISSKSVQGFRSTRGSKFAFPQYFGYWLLQQLVLPYELIDCRTTLWPASLCLLYVSDVVWNWCARRHPLDDDKNIVCRLIWIVLILGGIALALYQIHERILYFSVNPASTSVQLVDAKELRFPQVTICNENRIMKSKADRRGTTWNITIKCVKNFCQPVVYYLRALHRVDQWFYDEAMCSASDIPSTSKSPFNLFTCTQYYIYPHRFMHNCIWAYIVLYCSFTRYFVLYMVIRPLWLQGC